MISGDRHGTRGFRIPRPSGFNFYEFEAGSLGGRTGPDELLLFMHHVPYSHQLHSGKTVIQHIYDSHNQGVKNVENYISEWEKLKDLIDGERYNHTLDQLTGQLDYARVWRDSINNFFMNFQE